MPGLGASFGRGGATTAQWDLENSDAIMIMGSNMAECHPVAYRFVMNAREKGATIIHVDPRFTRTSATANIFAPIRAGSDIAFLGGMINYVIQNERYFHDYVVNYTNAAQIINPEYIDAENLEGIFSGYDETKDPPAYDKASWNYVGQGQTPHTHERAYTARAPLDLKGELERDLTLQHPNCVFQILKRHFARYTPEMVERVCGTPKETFLQLAEKFASASGRDKTAAICYAVGWTHHTTGVQMIRAASILQSLLGNMGRPGGGIMALRGHSTIQGSTDVPTLYNMLPGYIPMPTDDPAPHTMKEWVEQSFTPTGWWANAPKYMISMMKAFWGEHATAENDFAYNYMPKVGGDYSYMPMFMAAKDGKIKGMFVMGENFAVGGQNSSLEVQALQRLEWCVIRDPFPIETADFWTFEGADPTTIATEVFLMPASLVAEKDGTFTNTQRLIQWHDKAVDPPGDATSEMWFLYQLGKRLKELYKDSSLERDKPIQHVTWDYPTDDKGEPKVEAVVKEISGYTVADRKPVNGFGDLKDDGSTACGCWIYSGTIAADGTNRAANRKADPPGVNTNHSGWAFAWPANRRILYNRASADPQGNPWSEDKKLVWWDEAQSKWTGFDVPDFPVGKAPTTPANPDARGMDYHSGADPFILQPDGRAWLFAPVIVEDGPLPTHYEPVESPVRNSLYAQQDDPVAHKYERPDNAYNAALDPAYPYVATTYRVTEQHTSGAMSRWVPWLSELQPELFFEIDPELAGEKGVQNGDWVVVWSALGEIEGRAMVTNRMAPLVVDGARLHQIGLPYHWGSKGIVTGDVVNSIIPFVSDPTVHIHEAKAFTVNMRKGRKARHAASDPSSSNGVVVSRGGEAGDLADKAHLGVTDVMADLPVSTNAEGAADSGHLGANQGGAAPSHRQPNGYPTIT